MGGRDREFPPTLWSQVLRIREAELHERRDSLGTLIERYWKPVYAFLRAELGVTNERAKDLAQEFFKHFVERDLLSSVSPEKGRFRSFLRVSVRNFARNVFRDEGAQKRGGAHRQLPEEALLAVAEPRPDPALAAEVAFEEAWRFEVLRRGYEATRESFRSRGREVVWRVFEAIVLPAGERPTYQEVADRLGITATDVTNHLHAAKKKIKETTREILLEGLLDPADLDDEWKSVLSE